MLRKWDIGYMDSGRRPCVVGSALVLYEKGAYAFSDQVLSVSKR